jgi:hypothetical protein
MRTNPFPESDPDRREIWDFLVYEDSRDFLRADFTQCRTRFHEPAFYSLDAAGSDNPQAWKISFPSLDDYARLWVDSARALQPQLESFDSALAALLDLTDLSQIDISGDTALARKKFSGAIPLKAGRQSHVHWQTLYFLKRIEGRWLITGFLGYLPYEGRFRSGE